MQARRCQNMGLDQLMDRAERDTGMADQISQGGQAEINSLSRNALGLAIQRRMLSVFVEGRHRDQLRSGPTTGNGVEGRWRLADLLATPAGELLPHRLDHLPLAGGHFQRLGEVNAHLADKDISLRSGTLVDATIIDAPSSTKNKARARDKEMTSTKKGNDWYFGMKAHVGVDLDSGTVHSLDTMTAKVHDRQVWDELLHGE